MAARASKTASNTPAWLKRQKRFQMEFQFPHSAGRARQVMSSDVMQGEVMHRFEEPTVVSAFAAAARAHRPEHLNHPLPVLICHPRQHGWPPQTAQPESIDARTWGATSSQPIGIRPHRLVLTDIATGWTECGPLLVREQGLLSEVLTELRKLLPF